MVDLWLFSLFLKSKISVNKPMTIQALNEEIRRCISEIQPQLRQTVIENFVESKKVSKQSRGGHLHECCSIHNIPTCLLYENTKFWYFLQKKNVFYLKFKFPLLLRHPIHDAGLFYFIKSNIKFLLPLEISYCYLVTVCNIILDSIS